MSVVLCTEFMISITTRQKHSSNVTQFCISSCHNIHLQESTYIFLCVFQFSLNETSKAPIRQNISSSKPRGKGIQSNISHPIKESRSWCCYICRDSFWNSPCGWITLTLFSSPSESGLTHTYTHLQNHQTKDPGNHQCIILL